MTGSVGGVRYAGVRPAMAADIRPGRTLTAITGSMSIGSAFIGSATIGSASIGSATVGAASGIRGGLVNGAVARWVVAGAAAACVASGATVAVRASVPVGVVTLLLAVGVFAAGQLARLTFPKDADAGRAAWSEAGIVAVLCLVPAVWAPVTVFVAAVLGHGHRLVGAAPDRRVRVLMAISAVTAGAGAATVAATAATVLVGGQGVLAALRAPVPAELGLLATLVALLCAMVAYVAVTTSAAALALSSNNRGFTVVLRRRRQGRRLILAGNVAVGLAAATLISVGQVWLAPLVGLLALFHQVHAHRAYTGAQRRTWSALAEVTRSLSQPAEPAVATNCLRGLALLFAPDEVEITLNHPGGRPRVYQVRAEDLVQPPRPGRTEPERVWLTRRLSVGGITIGQLRMRRGEAMLESDQHALSTFADAAAAAFHDAVTHQSLRALEARSAYDAVHDPLTGLINRSAFLARGTSELRQVQPHTQVALLVLDVDGLRAVNDTLGHVAGDQLLATLARRLAERLGPAETLGRLGGDEFAILMLNNTAIPTVTGIPTATGISNDIGIPTTTGMPTTTDGQAVAGLASRPRAWSHPMERARSIAADLARPIEVDGVTICVEANAGLAVEVAGCVDMTELLRQGDVALHQAKGAGARVVRYEPGNDRFTADRLALLAELRDALAGVDQLTVWLQPTVDLITGAPAGAEALARWRHPRRGLLQPADFLGAVEHSELAGAFTRRVVEAAIDVAAGWSTQGLALPVSVNVCARCTLNPELATTISRRLASHGVDPQRLTVEITERVTAERLDLVQRVITDLRGLGVRVCVDDFGTGSASLSFLTMFPVDEVKIARSFVAAMLNSPRTAAIVRATIEMAHELGLRVVAKGVERVEQRDALVEMGVREGQGFLFHTPMLLAEATTALQARADRAAGAGIPLVRTDRT